MPQTTEYSGKYVRIHNLSVVLDRIRAIGGGAPKYMQEVLDRCMRLDVWPHWLQHITLQDHSLEDLRNLGHPYAVRFPVDSFVHPDSEVHEQSGSLAESSHIVDSRDVNGNPIIQLKNTSPEYVFLRYGTRTMRLRDPGGAALAESVDAIRSRFKNEVVDAIVKIYAR